MKGLRRDVQRACAQVEAIVDTDRAVTLAGVERELWTALLRLARCAVALFLARQAARPRSVEYRHEGVDYVLDRRRPARSEIGSRFGKVPFVRPVGRRADHRRGPRDLPIDRQLGLVGGFSLGTVAAMTRLCTQMAFGSARATFRSFCEWSPSQRAVLRMVDAVGAEARGFLEGAPPPPDDGDILVIQVDGRGAPMIDAAEYERRRQPRQTADGTARHRRRRRRRARVRPRRKKGDKSKNAKVAFRWRDLHPACHRRRLRWPDRETPVAERDEGAGVELLVDRLPFPAEVLDTRLVRVAAGRSNELHRHAHETVMIFVQGKARVRIDERFDEVGPGDLAFVPRWTDHQVESIGEEAVVYVAITDFWFASRALIGDYLDGHRRRRQADRSF
jgi:mannose-6-phosphate isomerase-like protein (cupin superfamily)